MGYVARMAQIVSIIPCVYPAIVTTPVHEDAFVTAKIGKIGGAIHEIGHSRFEREIGRRLHDLCDFCDLGDLIKPRSPFPFPPPPARGRRFHTASLAETIAGARRSPLGEGGRLNR